MTIHFWIRKNHLSFEDGEQFLKENSLDRWFLSLFVESNPIVDSVSCFRCCITFFGVFIVSSSTSYLFLFYWFLFILLYLSEWVRILGGLTKRNTIFFGFGDTVLNQVILSLLIFSPDAPKNLLSNNKLVLCCCELFFGDSWIFMFYLGWESVFWQLHVGQW